MMRRILWVMLLSLICGFVLGQRLPNTFVESPLRTIRLMGSFPLGSRVVPDISLKIYAPSEQLSWGEYAVVIGYDRIKGFHDEDIILCLVRTQMGSGPVLAISPDWLARISEGGTRTNRRSS